MKTIKIKYKLPNRSYSARKLKLFVNGEKKLFLLANDEISLEADLGDNVEFKLDYNRAKIKVTEKTEYITVFFDYQSEVPFMASLNSMFKKCLISQEVTKEEFDNFAFPEPKKVEFNKGLAIFGILCCAVIGVFSIIEYNKNEESLLAILLFLMSLNGVLFYLENLFSKFILLQGSKARITVITLACLLSIVLLPFSLLVKLMLILLISSTYIFSSKELAKTN